MKVVGVTGGIGSGKSTVCKIFSLLGAPVYNADTEAKKLYEQVSVKKKVVTLFGKSILTKSGKIDKIKLAGIVFNNSEALQKISAIIHPAVRKHFLKWKSKHKNKKYIIKEAAIMIESGATKDIDFLIAVSSPEKLRLQRSLQRGNLSKGQVLQRMKTQLTDKQRNKLSDAIVINDDKHSLIKQVLVLHKLFSKTYIQS